MDNYNRLVSDPSYYQTLNFNELEDSFVANAQETVQFEDVDYIQILKLIQGVFFDFYGTNLSSSQESQIIDELPNEIPNKFTDFEVLIQGILRDLKAYEWVDFNVDDETSPQKLQTEIDEIVETGNFGEIDESMIDSFLDKESQLTEKLSSYNNRLKVAQKVNEEFKQGRFNPVKRSISDYKTPHPKSLSDITDQYNSLVSDNDLGWNLFLGENVNNE